VAHNDAIESVSSQSLPGLSAIWYELQKECRNFSAALAKEVSLGEEGIKGMATWHARLHTAFLSFYDACLRFGVFFHPSVLGKNVSLQEYTVSPRAGLPAPFTLDRQAASHVSALASAALELGVAHGCPPDARTGAGLVALVGLRSVTSALFVFNTLARTGAVPGNVLECLIPVCIRHGGQAHVALAVLYAMDQSGMRPSEGELTSLVDAMDVWSGRTDPSADKEKGGEVDDSTLVPDARKRADWDLNVRALVVQHAYGLVRADAAEVLASYRKAAEELQEVLDDVGIEGEEEEEEEEEEDIVEEKRGAYHSPLSAPVADSEPITEVEVGARRDSANEEEEGEGRAERSNSSSSSSNGARIIKGRLSGYSLSNSDGSDGNSSSGGGSSGNEADSDSSDAGSESPYSSGSDGDTDESFYNSSGSVSTLPTGKESRLLADAAWWRRAVSYILDAAPPGTYTPSQFQALVSALKRRMESGERGGGPTNSPDQVTGGGVVDGLTAQEVQWMEEILAAFKERQGEGEGDSDSTLPHSLLSFPSDPSFDGGTGAEEGLESWINTARGYALRKETWNEEKMERVVKAARDFLAAASSTPNPLLGENEEDPRIHALLLLCKNHPSLENTLLESVRRKIAGGLRAGLFHVETGATSFQWAGEDESDARYGEEKITSPFSRPPLSSPVSSTVVGGGIDSGEEEPLQGKTHTPSQLYWPPIVSQLARKQLILALMEAAWRRAK